MKKQDRVDLNLATYPSRNRRFFYLLFGILSILIVVFLAIGAYTFWTYSAKNKNFRERSAQVERMIHETNRDEIRLTTQIQEATKTYQRKVDLLNTLILKKSFSWINFLSALEGALPSSCYIESLAPTLIENGKMEVRLKVAAPNLDELLKLSRNLYEKNFTGIRIISESINEAGLLIGEITLIYERTV